MTRQTPGNRIPSALSTERKIFGSYTLSDAGAAATPGVVVALAMQLLIPPSASIAGVSVHALTLPLAGSGIVCGMLFVYVTPQYTSSIDWFLTYLGYASTTARRPHDEAADTTQVARIYPDEHAIERTDGSLVGMVEVNPPTMALATSEEWTRKATSFQDFLNTTVEFPIQLYSTTHQFPAEAYVQQYEQRLDDPDVEASPQLAHLIESYVDWYLEDCTKRPTTIRDHYVIVPVTPSVVTFERGSIRQQLSTLPVVGPVVRALAAPPVRVQRQAMLDELDDRIRRIEKGVRNIEGCDSRRLPTDDICAVLAEYWTGDDIHGEQPSDRLRTSALVTTEDET